MNTMLTVLVLHVNCAICGLTYHSKDHTQLPKYFFMLIVLLVLLLSFERISKASFDYIMGFYELRISDISFQC